MSTTILLTKIDDLPIIGDAPLSLLRYAAKKQRDRQYNRQTQHQQPLAVAAR